MPIEIEVNGLAGWRQRDGELPVLALHGWLDNSHSFLDLAEQLPGIDLVALDFPGHGRSPWRAPGQRYFFDDYIFDVLDAADALGWPRFHLLGHSLGGAVSSVVAAAAPERIVSLSLIEGLGPLSAEIEQTAAGWRTAVARREARPRRLHPERADAVAARAANGDIDLADAERLAERGLIAEDGGWRWGQDPRLNWPSAHRYTENQVLDLLAAIRAPVLNVYSDPPFGLLSRARLQRRLAALRDQRLFSHPGGHHLHMRHPAVIGRVIKEFIHAQR